MTTADIRRAENAAWNRYQAAQSLHNSWSRVVALNTARGERTSQATLDDLIVARAAEFEARADWKRVMAVLEAGAA